MADALLGAVSQRFGTRRRAIGPRAETAEVRPLLIFFSERTRKRDVCCHRELSLGYFPETNQQRLTRKSPIDIYRAILPGSVSLVVSRYFGDLAIGGPDVFTSIMLMSSLNLART
jgi:hypothetical protein